uniref:Uncharacterized protein n=1 Tax=viral metagenome TaxID=1070528 RepID=A0A6C0JGF4_9ZZZZ
MTTGLSFFSDLFTDDYIGNSSVYLLFGFNMIYFATLFGIVYVNSSYINVFNIVVHVILCLFLIVRFNPLRKDIVIKKYDQVFIFSTAIFLLLNLGVIEYINKFVDTKKIKKMVTFQ